jgi:hypothetical protein
VTDALDIALGAVVGLASSNLFVVGLFIGFCVLVGLVKLKRTAGRGPVIRSLDEAVTHQPTRYLSPFAPRGPADQLRTPELLESTSRPS